MSVLSALVLSRNDRRLDAGATLPAARPNPVARERGAASQAGHYSVGDVLKYLDANEDGD